MHKPFFAAFLAFTILLTACSNPQNDVLAEPVEGSPAPDFELQTPDGETIRLSDQRGKVVLVNFWATWCGPCRIEMPAIQARFERYAPGFMVLAVDNDESAEMVADFFGELELSFPALLDPGGEIQSLYRVRGYPSSYFVDEEGLIQVAHVGIMTEGQLDDYLGELGVGE